MAQVTVLMANYNNQKYIREAVSSVFNQTYKNWRLVIVDDASTDNSLEEIEDFLEDERVTLLKNEINLGQSKTQNRGLEVISTPFILMLDSDDWFFPYTIEVLMKESESLPEDVALLCGNKRFVFEDLNGNYIGKYDRIYGRNFDDPYEFLLENYVPYPRLYRTSAIKEIGGWPTDDPHKGRYLEDRRIDVKIIEKYKIYWVNHLLYNYRQHTSNLTKNRNVMNEMIEWNIRDALKRWGSKYKPIFGMENGWKYLVRLVELKNRPPLIER